MIPSFLKNLMPVARLSPLLLTPPASRPHPNSIDPVFPKTEHRPPASRPPPPASRPPATSSTRFCYAPLLRGPWHETSPLHFSRCNPLVGVFAGGGRPRFIIAGGARFMGGLVDIEDRLAVEIYDTASDSWELCSPLPPDFRSGNSSQWLSGALLGGRLFFIFGIYSCSVAAFDLGRWVWTAIQTLRPPGVLFSFLLACGDRLILAGLCNSPDGSTCFALWAVDPRTMDFTEIAVMPHDLLASLFDTDDDDTKFASLKCIGLDGLIYVFNEDHHKAYPACVCEITTVRRPSSLPSSLPASGIPSPGVLPSGVPSPGIPPPPTSQNRASSHLPPLLPPPHPAFI